MSTETVRPYNRFHPSQKYAFSPLKNARNQDYNPSKREVAGALYKKGRLEKALLSEEVRRRDDNRIGRRVLISSFLVYTPNSSWSYKRYLSITATPLDCILTPQSTTSLLLQSIQRRPLRSKAHWQASWRYEAAELRDGPLLRIPHVPSQQRPERRRECSVIGV